METTIDLKIPEMSYLFGFLQADGHLSEDTRNRGKLTIELQEDDQDILKQFQELLPTYSSIRFREREIFLNGYHYPHYKTAIWTFCNQSVRESLNELGIPYGKKNTIVSPPQVPFSAPDYFRGFLDGDGSLGITGNGIPFLGWSTNSADLNEAIVNFITSVTGKQKTVNPNKRDKMYNPTVWKEDAQKIAAVLYYDGCMALKRKTDKAKEVVGWVRPDTMKKVTWQRKKWTPEEDVFINSHSVPESMKKLGRNERSIRIRLSRLRLGYIKNKSLVL